MEEGGDRVFAAPGTTVRTADRAVNRRCRSRDRLEPTATAQSRAWIAADMTSCSGPCRVSNCHERVACGEAGFFGFT
jgi:hypothetical protein